MNRRGEWAPYLVQSPFLAISFRNQHIVGPRKFPPAFLIFSANILEPSQWRQGLTQLTEGDISWGLLQRLPHKQPGKRSNETDLGDSRALLFTQYSRKYQQLAVQQLHGQFSLPDILKVVVIWTKYLSIAVSSSTILSTVTFFQKPVKMSNEGNELVGEGGARSSTTEYIKHPRPYPTREISFK